jgi:hypothetical protein
MNPVAGKIYAASAATLEQIKTASKNDNKNIVENIEKNSQNNLRDDSVKVSISPEAKNLLALLEGEKIPVEQIPDDSSKIDYGKRLQKRRRTTKKQSTESEENKSTATQKEDNSSEIDYSKKLKKRKKLDNKELSDDEEREIDELKKRDQEVKQHERMHVAVGGSYVRGGPTYDYQEGADGMRYAIGGHVDIDTGKETTPEETIKKAKTIKAAATAPGAPSPADLKIAAQATKMEAEAIIELNEKNNPAIEK